MPTWVECELRNRASIKGVFEPRELKIGLRLENEYEVLEGLTEGERVVGYYAVSSYGIGVAGALGRFRRNMPDPIPVVLLGRLAIDRGWQGKGMGRALFRDCAMRVAHAADTLGIRGIVVHAISEKAKAFYLALGFEVSPLEPMTLMVTLNDVRAMTR